MESPQILRKRVHERGGILVTAILVIIVMLLIAIPFLFKLSAGHRSTERGARALMAFNLAEAGVDKVLWYLNPYAQTTGTDQEAIQWDFTGVDDVGVINDMKTADNTVMGDVRVVLTPPAGVPPVVPTRTLTGTGFVPFVGGNTVDRTVRVTLQQEYHSIFEVGFFVDEYFYLRNSFLLDAYNSNDGPYGGSNALLPDVYFGSNSYVNDENPRNPGDATWTIRSGGGSSSVYGTILAGGSAAEAYNDGTAPEPPDPALLDEVISVPTEDIFKGTEDRMTMKQAYDLPPVDVFDLPPKDLLGSIPSVGDWFPGYDAANPDASTGYYPYRMLRAPEAGEIAASLTNPPCTPGTPHNEGTVFSGSGTLTPANNGVYTSFSIGGVKTPGTLTISGGDVVIYVTSYGDSSKAASFYMGSSSSINIEEGSTLTLIFGNASMTVEQGYNINAQGSNPQAGDCVILGTNQFTVPPNTNVDSLPNKADSVDKLAIPGLMYFEHAQSDGNIYAAMYVPGAHVTTGQGQNHMNYYGALICNSMDFKNQVDFHYDKALADLHIVDGGFEYWTIINWTEVVGN
ncbi:MAG: hypothetical protein PHX45_10795 [Acidobacteriota bacterium]|nr:hypothetical protein [Acidobacteriota bacterium]